MKIARRFGKWVKDHIDDPWVKKSQVEKYRSRASYKLLEMNQRYKLLRPKTRVLELGCAPGGWTQVAVDAVKSKDDKPIVFAIDTRHMLSIIGADFHQLDITDENISKQIWEIIKEPVDVVLSDVSHNHRGNADMDWIMLCNLHTDILEICSDVLKPGGIVLAKVLQGAYEPELFKHYKTMFKHIQRVKPDASRKQSREIYYLAKGWRQTKFEITDEEEEKDSKEIANFLLKTSSLKGQDKEDLENFVGPYSKQIPGDYSFLNDKSDDEKDVEELDIVTTEYLHEQMPTTILKPMSLDIASLVRDSKQEYDEMAKYIAENRHKTEPTYSEDETDLSDDYEEDETKIQEDAWYSQFIETNEDAQTLMDDKKSNFNEKYDDDSDGWDQDDAKMQQMFEDGTLDGKLADKGPDQYLTNKEKMERGSKHYEDWYRARMDSNVWDKVKRK